MTAQTWRDRAAHLEGHTGPMDFEHKNPPAPFNPIFDPEALSRRARVTASMQADRFYQAHDRAACRAEWARRYELLKASGDAATVRF